MKEKKSISGKTIWISVAGLVVMTVAVNSIIWWNVIRMENNRKQEHIQLTDRIAKTSEAFLLNREDHYFYDVLKLMVEMPFLRCLTIYLDSAQIVKLGKDTAPLPEEAQSMTKTERLVALDGPQSLLVSLPLEYEEGKKAQLLARYSMHDMQWSKRVILASIILSLLLVAVLTLLLLVLHKILLRLQATEETKKYMLSAISHHAMHHVGAIDNKCYLYLSKRREGVSDAVVQKDMQVIRDNNDTVSHIIENLKYHELLSQGKVVVRKHKTDISGLISMTVDSYQSVLQKKDMQVRQDLQHGCGVIETDEAIVRLVLFNLIDNAIKYSETGSDLRIACQCTPREMQIVIQDAGRGIARQDWAKVFKPYHRLIEPNKSVQGTGLGLSNAKQLIKAMGGDVTLERSEIGKGSVFMITIPTGKTEVKS